MKKKIKIDEIVVVEGKDDVATISQVIDATIIPLHGSVGLSSKKITMLKELSKKNTLLLLTDPDFTGKKIREKINKNISNVINLYVSRNKAIKKNNIGVENVEMAEIYNIFYEYINSKNDIKREKSYEYKMLDLIEYGLTGKDSSKYRRELLGDLLKIGYYNSKSLLMMLNSINISYDEFLEKINIMDKMLDKKEKIGIIFGKFIPLHNGHINFINYVSKEVDKLYVCLCVEKERDDKLLLNSTLPKYISEIDRIKFLKNEISNLTNTKVLFLREEGIKPYPDGWKEWTNRVINLLEKENIVINAVYTNEIDDKENYEKYFVNKNVFSKELEVHLIDPKRFEYNISSTKIRNEYIKYKNYLPKNIVKFLENNV